MDKNEQDIEEQKRLFRERLEKELNKKKERDFSTYDIFLNASFGIIMTLVMMFIMAAFNGWALSLLWFWFIAYPFKVKAISIAHAYGLVLITQFIKNGLAKEQAPEGIEKDGYKATLSVIFGHIFTVGVFLLIGWLTFTLFIV